LNQEKHGDEKQKHAKRLESVSHFSLLSIFSAIFGGVGSEFVNPSCPEHPGYRLKFPLHPR
jgi:hypothetical protein